jgi:RHS repeat-associated protein
LTFEWDAANRLAAINYVGTTNRSEFTYDGLSRRVKIVEKTGFTITSTKQFVWIRTQIEEERDGNNLSTCRYFEEGEERSGSSDAVYYYYTRDHLGSIREMTDSFGTVQARYDYDPYGRRTKLSGGLEVAFGYTGHYHHAPSSLNLTLHRAYNPDLGRWISRDPIAERGGLNLYAYVENDPANLTDALGLRQTLRDILNAVVTAGVMTYQAWMGNPGKIQAPNTPTSQRVVYEERIRTERKKRPRKPTAGAACISILWDPFDDLDLILDYDLDKSLDENLQDEYGPPPLRS